MRDNYNLYQQNDPREKTTGIASLRKLVSIIGGERRNLIVALTAILINAMLGLAGPYLVGYTIDTYVQSKQFQGVLLFSGILLAIYAVAFVVNYLQMRLMGGIGQRMLYRLRNSIFDKLQELPLDFFNQNKAGDLISRINNDTEKVNQFFSQSLMQFIGSIFTITGAAVILLIINLPLGLAALSPAVLVWLFTRFVSPWVKRRNAASLKSTGGLSAEIQESLANFKVVIAFNRRDYFRNRFEAANQENLQPVGAGGDRQQHADAGVHVRCKHRADDCSFTGHLPDHQREFYHRTPDQFHCLHQQFLQSPQTDGCLMG